MKKLLIIFLLLFVSGHGYGQNMTPYDFYAETAIATDAHSSLYRVNIPIEVYRNTHYEDLRDIRIVNGKNEFVPFAFLPKISILNDRALILVFRFFPF